MNSKEFIKAVDAIVKEKNIDREYVFEAMELALATAYKKNLDSLTNSKIFIDRKTGDIKEILKSFSDEYDIAVVAATQRIVHSPKSHTFGSVIYEKKTDSYYEEKPYEKIEVVDRIGSGDAYISGFLYGLLKENGNCQAALEYGNAASAMKNTVSGDMLWTDPQEMQQTIEMHHNIGQDFEMKR